MSKQGFHRCNNDRFILKRLNEVERKGKYRTEISNIAASEGFDADVEMNSAW